MMKNIKQTIKCHPYCALFFLTLFFCIFFCLSHGAFGAKVDWISQHSVLPDYFRRHFYETGKIFPEFALNIGGGQNIYNFSYYGLYNPIILLSYLFPFIKMSDYMMGAQFFCLVASVMLLYRWIIDQKVSFKIGFGVSILFLLSGPMIYHSYNQIMFVNYMPFLCMAFLGIDRYFEELERKKRVLLIIGIFLMIMTSFYFSIGGMLALTIYAIFRYFMMCEKKKKEITVRLFVKDGIEFSLCFLIPIFMSAILLIPTEMALAGRESSRMSIDFVQLFLPQISLKLFLYNPYGIGLSTLAMICLIAMLFFPKRYEKMLALGCLLIFIIPLFSYFLNGGLYIREKAMIPFLPLLCYVMAYYLNRMEKEQTFSLFYGMIPYIAVIIVILWKREESEISQYIWMILADAIIMLFCWLLFYKKRQIFLLIFPPIVFLFGYGMVMHTTLNKFCNWEFYETVTDESTQQRIEDVLKKESGFYRMEQIGTRSENEANLNRVWDMGQYISSMYSSSYNVDYQEFRTKIFQIEQPFRNFLMQSVVPNPVFRKFMGIKYTIQKKKIDVDEVVSPIIYATNQVLSEETYKKLQFPFNQLVLLQNAVTDQKDKTKEHKYVGIEEFDGNLPSVIKKKEAYDQSIQLPDSFYKKERILFVTFEVDNLCPSKDISIWIGGSKNKLTAKDHVYYNENQVFHYAVPVQEGKKKVNVIFGEGNYKIKNAKYYVANLSEIEEGQKQLYQSEFIPKKEKIKDNVIEGTIDVEKDGYLITTIPYDKNFEIQIDGKQEKIKKVNTAFLGCKIEQGRHLIEIEYHAPGVTLGKIISVFGVFFFILLIGGRKVFKKYYVK